MKVLYINHVSPLAGSSRSLLELLNCLPCSKVNKFVISPKGEFANEIIKNKIPFIQAFGISQFCNTEYGYYRSTRWLILIREFLFFLKSILTFYNAKKKWGDFDIIHLNEMTLIPNIIILNLFFKNAKYVMHARSIQRTKENFLLKFLNSVFKKYIDIIIAIDDNVYESLDQSLNKIKIHNSLDSRKVKISKLKHKTFNIGMVGLLNKSKGCSVFIEAANLAKKNNFDLRFILFGDLKNNESLGIKFLKKILFLNENNSNELKQQILDLKLSKFVKIYPFENDLNKIYNSIEVLCFPSLLFSPGRPVFEAGFYKTPSIVTIKNPKKDTFSPNVTGLLIKPYDSKDLLEKILILKNNKKLKNELGMNAYKMSIKNFNANTNAKKIFNLYEKIIIK